MNVPKASVDRQLEPVTTGARGLPRSQGSRRPRIAARAALALAGTFACSGCVGDRILRITSIPEGANVRLDDQLIGRTPIDVPFRHYGIRRLSLYREGYRTYSEPLRLRAPLWARFPMDILTEVILPLGLDDVRDIQIDLVADTGAEALNASTEFAANARRARAGEDLSEIPVAGSTGVKPPLPLEDPSGDPE